MPVSSAELVDALAAHGLLSTEQVRAARERVAVVPEAEKLAGELVERGWLTDYQATELLRGRGEDLAVGPYRLLEPLARGGMGQVYRARHPVLNREVALKLILPERLGSDQAVERF